MRIMDYYRESDFYKPLLQPGEMLLWHGSPGPGKLNTYGRVPILFAVVWLVFVLFFEITAIRSRQIIMIIFGFPFVGVGFSMLFGPFLKNARLKGKIFYAITNQRLLICEGNNIKIFTADMLPAMQIHMNKNGTGTIYFERMYYSRRSGNQFRCICALQNLTDVSQAQSALSIMMTEGKNNEN